MVIRMKKLKENAILPVRSHDNDAGADLFACIVNTPPQNGRLDRLKQTS